ncbi:MAG: 6-hydroxymethylpterin diphosphokinase MptE-like protein [Halobacteria archaeon]
MNYREWSRWYDSIREDFGYAEKDDRRTARYLDETLSDRKPSPGRKNISEESSSDGKPFSEEPPTDRKPYYEESFPDLEEKEAVVAGNAPCLARDIRVRDISGYVVAADGAAVVLIEEDVKPDLVVTDLDGSPGTAAELSRRDVSVVVHAHGDNEEALERWLPEFDLTNVVGSTQTDPSEYGNLVNFGGFTDGDRGAFLADELGASSIELVGWDFGDPTVSRIKKQKLNWARRLLRVLSWKRDESILV